MGIGATRVSRGQWRALAVIAAGLLTACSDKPNAISLQLLAAEQQTVSGQLVMTDGVVRRFDDPRHYWIEDEMLNRVAIHPEDAISDKVGEHVEVIGRFYADRERGRRIEVREVSIVGYQSD